ncbi:MAG: sulfatase-like hydrolase/transferase [Chthoniobacteraceae bacterium]
MTPPRQPNVIVFFTDQQRWDCSGLHGNPLDLMSNFDRMARLGTHVARSFTCQPVCGPARSCLQTGQYATRTGCYRNSIPLATDAVTLAKCFGKAGYHTAYIGKWHLGDDLSAGPVREEQRGGYAEWLAGNIPDLDAEPYNLKLYGNDGAEQRFPGYRVDAQTDAAIRFLGCQQADKPFFLFNSYLEPHHHNRHDHYPAPAGYEERYQGKWMPPDLAAMGGNAHKQIGGYYGMVKRIDEALGRMLDALKSLGMEENTIVLFTSDHGCHFKTRNDEYKRSCHDASIRVPTAITGPGFRGGGHVDALVSLVDLPPTLLDAAGLAVPESMQGRSILPLLRGEKTAWPEEVLVQISESQVGRAIRTRRWKYAVTAPGLNGWENSASDSYVEAHLYDLETDPYELNNLVSSKGHEAVRKELRERLLARMEEAGEPEAEIVAGAFSC